MEQIKQKLQILAGRWNLTKSDSEPEEIILTEQEKQEALSHAIQQKKDLFQFRRLEQGEKLDKIVMQISGKNWSEEIDSEEILRIANSNKHYDLWQKEQRAKEKQAELDTAAELSKRYTAKFVFNFMSWTSKNVYGKALIVNNDNSKLITAICFYISNDERFEKELGFSFKKGLLIRGPAGVGKTHLLNCVKDNEIKPISVYSMIEIAEKVKEDGVFHLHTTKGIHLDDVGTEEATVNHYGTKINFFKNFIEKYYLDNRDFSKLIVSTNSSFKEIEVNYGFRVRSRMKDMFNIIDVTGNDMRG